MEILGIVLISFADIFIIFIGLFEAWKILRGEIDVTKVISEEGWAHQRKRVVYV